ncbi:hypothetical protein SVIOM342S_10409 [Streptomyces violaceorubidus]
MLVGEDAPYDTASIVKVDILATLLLQAQDAGRNLTAAERALAEPMIRKSDNAATNKLWREIGGASGLREANKRMGLTSTKGGPGTKWGLTQTTASDQIRLLLSVFEGPATLKTDSPLNKDSRAYIRTLMTHVASDQAWGVSAVSGSDYALKNGWLQRTTSGLWDVNSVAGSPWTDTPTCRRPVGRQRVNERRCLIRGAGSQASSGRDHQNLKGPGVSACSPRRDTCLGRKRTGHLLNHRPATGAPAPRLAVSCQAPRVSSSMPPSWFRSERQDLRVGDTSASRLPAGDFGGHQEEGTDRRLPQPWPVGDG